MIMTNPTVTSKGSDLLQRSIQLNKRVESKSKIFSDNFLSAAQIAHQALDIVEEDDTFEQELKAAESEAEHEMRKIVTEFSNDDD